MGPVAQAEARRLLALHPSAEYWETNARLQREDKDSREILIFAEAATWADDIKHLSDLELAEDLLGIDVGKDWHYVNWPIDGTGNETREGRLDVQLLKFSTILADKRRPDAERSNALVWLLHLVADAHQPLHAATRLSRNGKNNDAGGNAVRIVDAKSRRLPKTNLHQFWDNLPAPPWLRGKQLLSTARRLDANARKENADLLDIKSWLDESHTLAKTEVYRAIPRSTAPFTINDNYRARSLALADERIAISGIRLGRWLNRLLSP